MLDHVFLESSVFDHRHAGFKFFNVYYYFALHFRALKPSEQVHAVFSSLCIDTLCTKPSPAITVNRKVRPDDMNGNGSPVIGTSPIDIAMLM
jgi:hypothetical protein